MNIAEYLRSSVLKNMCEWLLLSDVISRRLIYSNLAFAQPILLKLFFQIENIKIISEIVNLKKKNKSKILICMSIYFFTTISLIFTKILKVNIGTKFTQREY